MHTTAVLQDFSQSSAKHATASSITRFPGLLLLQIEFLEVRLAEVMAYADIPINMRPALTEMHPNNMQPGIPAMAGMFSSLSGTRAPADIEGPDGEFVRGSSGVAGGVKATQVELIRGALLGCLKMLRQMSEALGESAAIGKARLTQTSYSRLMCLVWHWKGSTLPC